MATRPAPFDLSTPTSVPSTPASEQQPFVNGTTTPARTRSILNLTSSTLFGIYRDTDYTEREELSTPWGTGARTPVDEALRKIPDAFTRPKRLDHRRKGLKGYWLPLIGKSLVLFTVGVLYGLLVSHLHNRDDVAPVKVEGINHSAWEYLVLWGLAGVVLGHTLPTVDSFWTQRSGRGSGGWNDVLRSIGAFVGVAFAIRKLPWQSTLQLSLTLALANPAVWYLIDRSVPGLLVSMAVAVTGTASCLLVNPGLVPPPMVNAAHNHEQVLGLFSEETVGVATWIASVLFVSAVCFGNIGRRLAS